MQEKPVAISIIVPTLNEAANLPELARRLDAVLAGRDYEVLIVDDASVDDTPSVCAQLATQYPLRLYVRQHPKDGLSGAVLEGMGLANGQTFVVMDADLQHPPERVPALLEQLDAGAEFALGSRYVQGGSMEQKWGMLRKLNSRIATVLARPFAGRTSDPMSGFFALRSDTFRRGRRLAPLGYKVGLELMCKCHVGDVREVPIHFSTRAQGESKLTLVQQFKYLEHLSRLYDFFFPRASPIVKFLIATACGWFVGFVAYLLLLQAGFNPVAAPSIAYLFTILTTAVFHLRYVRTQREFLVSRRPWLDFFIIALAEWVICTSVAHWWVHRVDRSPALEVFVLSFGSATLIRYILRKEFMHDIRGLRQDFRKEEWTAEVSRSRTTTVGNPGSQDNT